MGLSVSERKKRIDVCGDSAPCLVHEFGLEDLREQVEKFCKAVFGAPNVAEKRTSVKQAHTMLVLQPSPDMKERECPSFVPLLTADADDGSAKAKPLISYKGVLSCWLSLLFHVLPKKIINIIRCYGLIFLSCFLKCPSLTAKPPTIKISIVNNILFRTHYNKQDII